MINSIFKIIKEAVFNGNFLILNRMCTLVLLHIWGYNHVMFAVIYHNEKWLLELILGWDGVRITPIMANPAPSDSAHFVLLGIFLLYNIVTLFICVNIIFKRDTAADAFDILIHKCSGIIGLYMLGHFLLFVAVLAHNWEWGAVSFDLSLQDVRLCPKPK